MKHLILLRYLKEHFRSVSVEISDSHSLWTLNVTLLRQELGKITYFSTVVSFAAMVNKLNEKIRHQISNLVLFHKKAIFQVVLTSTSRKTHAQECAKIILENMGKNEKKTDISLKWILTVLNRLHHDEKTQENTPSESFDGDISKVWNVAWHSFKVIPLKLIYCQTFFETWFNYHSWYKH